MPSAPQGAPDWQAKVLGQVVRLVEAAAQGTPRMALHLNHGVCTGQNVPPLFPHHCRERRSEHTTSAVLERMDDLPQGIVIVANTACDGEAWWSLLTVPAQ